MTAAAFFPAYSRAVVVVDPYPVHAAVHGPRVGIGGEDQGERDEASAVAGPAFQEGIECQVRVAPHHLAAGGDGHLNRGRRRLRGGQKPLHERGQRSEFIDAQRRRHP